MEERTKAFHEERCDLCGLCLNLCPVMELPLDEAKREFKALMEGKESRYALRLCNSCMSCNLYCPREANPYQLILERWNDLYSKRGAPPLYKFVCPTEEPNIWQLINIFLSDTEKKWIAEWMGYVPKPDDTVFLVGNYTHLFPFIVGGSSLLGHFKPIDRIDQWEGGAYLYQGGYLNIVCEIAKRSKEDFERWGVKDVVIPTDAVHHIFSKVHPEEMGVIHNRNFIPFHDWLLEKMNSGEISLSKAPLNITVTVHDNCYSKVLGGRYWDTPREILKLCGCDIVEMAHIKKDALCCGFGAGASWVRNISIPFDIIWEGKKKFKEAEESGADALVSYCSGCIYLLWAARELLESKIDVFHIIEVIRMAMGEKINYPDDHVRRAWDIIAIINYQLLISLFQKNFFIKKITYDRTMSTFKHGNYPLLKLIRRILENRLARKVYARIFRMLMTIMTTRKRS